MLHSFQLLPAGRYYDTSSSALARATTARVRFQTFLFIFLIIHFHSLNLDRSCLIPQLVSAPTKCGSYRWQTAG
jgi:hypothetical protein